jgi:glycosyltransferase involved in cell wall biosynthesis
VSFGVAILASSLQTEIASDSGPARRSLDAESATDRSKRVCMLAYTAYESDGRVRRYAEALANRGDHVDVIALSSGAIPLGVEELNGVTVYRLQRRNHDERHKWTYVWRLLRFLIVASLFLVRHQRRVPYDLIHVHNVPDFLVFAALYPRFKGAKVILDIHDIVPELFACKFGVTANSPYIRLLRLIEKVSAAFVDHVIVSNHFWYETLTSRSVTKERCSVFINHVDPVIFRRRERTRNDGKLILLFPGTFQRHQGLDVAIEALAHIKKKVPSAELHLYGGGGVESDLVEQAARLELSGSVKFFGGVPYDRIAEVIANADVGIVPKRVNSFGNEAYSTKTMEFMSQGVPVVASRTKIDSFYYDDSLVRFFASGDSEAMAEAVLTVVEDNALRESIIAKGLEYADRNSWEHNYHNYLGLVDRLLATTSPILPACGPTRDRI